MNNQIILLKQKPIIEHSQMKEIGLRVAEDIAQLNLGTIEPNELNRSMMKKMRAKINKDLDVFENQRRMIHAEITSPYKIFTGAYETHIKSLYVDASAQLKDKIASVEAGMISDKKADIEAYFNTVIGDIDFLTIESIGLNIILSASNKKLQEQALDFIGAVQKDLNAIDSMDNQVRIESLYKTNLDLGLSVSTVNNDIKREKEQKAERIKQEGVRKAQEIKRLDRLELEKEQDANDRVARKKAEDVRLEEQRIQAEKNVELNKTKEAAEELERIEAEKKRAAENLMIAEKEKARIEAEKEAKAAKKEADEKIHSMSFKVAGTIAQLKEIKVFLDDKGIIYE